MVEAKSEKHINFSNFIRKSLTGVPQDQTRFNEKLPSKLHIRMNLYTFINRYPVQIPIGSFLVKVVYS